VVASVRLWSTTPGSNTNLDTGANWPEGMNPSAVNDAARGTQAAVRKMLNDLSAKIIAGGSANAITLTTDSGWAAGDLANGAALMFRAASTNTSATVTIAVDGLSAKNVFREDGTALRIGDIVANGIYQVAYSATAGGFLLLNGTLPSLSGARELLTAARTYYVRTDGSDSNNGLANTAGGAFLTLQKAANAVAAIDASIYDVTIQVGAGTYTAGVTFKAPLLGTGSLSIIGDTTTPSNCLISVTGGDCIGIQNGCAVNISGLKLATTTSGNGIVANGNAIVTINGKMDFGAVVGQQIYTLNGAKVTCTVAYNITGGAARHMYAAGPGSQITNALNTVTITGTPAFGTAFAVADTLAAIVAFSQTYSGSATGTRYTVTTGAGINTAGGGASYFPGNAAGSATSPGWYA